MEKMSKPQIAQCAERCAANQSLQLCAESSMLARSVHDLELELLRVS